MNLGDVYWVEFPPRAGHEQAGRRPAVVFQDAKVSQRLPTVLLIPLTTRLDALRFPGTVLIETDPENGLHRPSVALAFQLTALDRRFIGSRSGHLSASVRDAIRDALDEVTGAGTPDQPPSAMTPSPLP